MGGLKSTLEWQKLAGTLLLPLFTTKSRDNKIDRVEICRLTPPSRKAILHPVAFWRRSRNERPRDITCRYWTRSGWMQTNFLWASHEHLIFVQRAVKSWIEMSHRGNSFGRIVLPARWRGGVKMKKAQLQARSCNGIHFYNCTILIFSFAW